VRLAVVASIIACGAFSFLKGAMLLRFLRQANFTKD